MAIIVEDGSGVTGANSYVSVSDFRTFNALRGQDVTSLTDDEVEILLIKSMDYIESYRNRFKGWKTDQDQALQWPRYNVVIDQYTYIESNEIPVELKNAQIQCAYESNSIDISPNVTGKEIIMRQVDTLRLEYAQNGSNVETPTLSKVNKFITPLLKGAEYVGRVHL